MRNIEIIKDELIGESIKRIKHKSGLTVLVCEKELTAFYALFATKYGSKDNVFDVDGQRVAVPNGIAHFLEHKLFETEDGRDSFELFSELGADANAYTGFERTAYLFSGTENFYETLEVLINMVRTPVFTKENVKKRAGNNCAGDQDVRGQTVGYEDLRTSCRYVRGGISLQHPDSGNCAEHSRDNPRASL